MNKTEVTCSKQEVEGTTLPKETLKQITKYCGHTLKMCYRKSRKLVLENATHCLETLKKRSAAAE
jgi:hypothetical protein